MHPAAPDPAPVPADEPWFQLLVENAHDIITVVDVGGAILYDSPAVLPVLGYAPGELVGRSALELVHPDDFPAALDLLLRTAAVPGSTASLVFRFLHRDGSWRTLESVGRTLEGQRVVVTSRDVTDRARSLQALSQEVRDQQQRLQEAQVEMLERLARAAECRDDDTGQHTRRVGDLAAALAAALGAPPPAVETLRRAAPLHDVGKIGIRDAILLKPGPLTPEETEVMRSHTVLGARILAHGRSDLVQEAEQVALAHHEQWDGRGYPRGLREREIPLSARIVALADFFDALTHDRPYRRALPRDQVVRHIREESGQRFDPEVVDAFLELDPARRQELAD